METVWVVGLGGGGNVGRVGGRGALGTWCCWSGGGEGVDAGDLGGGEGEVCVGETVAEGEARHDVVLVQVAVVDVEALGEGVLRLADGEASEAQAGREVAFCLWDAVGEFAARRDVAVQDVGERAASFLAGQVGEDDGLDGGEVDPVLDEDGANGVDDDDDGRVGGGGLLDEVVAAVPGVEAGAVAVAVVAFDGDVVLARVGVDEDDGHIGGLRVGVGREGVAREIGDCRRAVLDGVDGSVHVRVVGGSGAPAHAESALVASLVGAGVDSVGVCLGVVTEDLERRSRLERESVVDVLEQRDGILGDLPSDLVVVALYVDILIDHPLRTGS